MDNNVISSTTPVYTLSIVSMLTGIPVHSVRQYVDRGLIIPFKKPSGRNLFSQIDIIRLQYINKLLEEKGLNIAGIRALFAVIPCWALKNCPLEVKLNCRSFKNDELPCWAASEKGESCKNANCRECEVYRIIEDHQGVKSILKSLI